MRKNKFPKIEIRLLLTLAITILIISIISIVYILDVRNMNYLTQEIIDHPYTVSNSVRDIEININAIHRSMKDVVLAKNETQLNQAINDVHQYEKLVYKKFEVVENQFLGDLNTVHDAKQCFKNSKSIRDEVIDLVKRNKLTEAAEILNSKGAQRVKLLFSKTHEMIDFANNMAKEFNDNSIRLMDSSRNKTIVLSLSTFLIGIIVFLWLYNSISKPINHLISRVLAASKKQTVSNLPIQANNKLVILDYAIGELENREKILGEEISTRTKELKEARNLLENAIDNAPIGIVEVGLDGKFKKANHEFCDMLGYTFEELSQFAFNELTVEEDKNIGAEFVKKAIEGGVLKGNFEKRYNHKSGKIVYASLTTILIKDAKNKPIHFFSHIKDITLEKEQSINLFESKNELENIVKNRTKELEDKTSKLQKSQKALTYLLEDVNESQEKMKMLNEQVIETNKELEAFSYSVSHDLKAPLRAITGFSQILIEDYSADLSQEIQRYLNLINNNAENMGALITDLISFSRLGRKALQISPVNMNELSTRIKSELALEIKDKKLALKILPMPLLHADEALMHHVMTNLLSNAVKFSSKAENATVEIGCNSKNNENLYYVKDNGIGFDMKYADKVFDVFQRLHSSDEFPGTGIGLSIVQRIIHKHNGKIWVESEKNKGTTFFFTI